MLFGFVCLFSLYLQLFVGGSMSYLCYLSMVIWVCLFSLYLQLFVGGSMSYLCYLGLFV